MKHAFFLFVLLLATNVLQGQSSSKIIMADYMGINTNVAAYDNKFLADLSKIQRMMKKKFPNAMEFKRPGFDD